MKTDRELMAQVRHAIDDCTRGVDRAPSLRCQILSQAKGETPVKKKYTVALAMAMLLLVSGALAATLLNSGVLYWLFRGSENEVPPEVAGLVDQPDQSYTGDAIALTLNETLFDGMKLSVGFTLRNPTQEPLVYTVSQAMLDGRLLVAESALLPYGGSHGQALGGQVDGAALPSEAEVYATFSGLGSAPQETSLAMRTPAPLQPMDGAVLSVCVDVYRPRVPLTFLAPGEYVNDASAFTGGGLALERDSNLLPLQPLLMDKVDSQVYTFPIRMSSEPVTRVSAAPGVYQNDLFSLEVEAFTLLATGGQLEANITIPSPAAVADRLPEDLSFFYVFPEAVFGQARTANDWTPSLHIRTQSGGGYVDPASTQPTTYHVDASFGPAAGALPTGVYLVWMTGNTGFLDWDTALYIPMN